VGNINIAFIDKKDRERKLKNTVKEITLENREQVYSFLEKHEESHYHFK